MMCMPSSAQNFVDFESLVGVLNANKVLNLSRSVI
jgi:hypothetical protein